MMLAMRMIVPRLVVKAQLQQAARREKHEEQDKQQLAAAYLTSGIVAGALLEGAGFLNFNDCTEKTSFTKHFAE